MKPKLFAFFCALLACSRVCAVDEDKDSISSALAVTASPTTPPAPSVPQIVQQAQNNAESAAALAKATAPVDNSAPVPVAVGGENKSFAPAKPDTETGKLPNELDKPLSSDPAIDALLKERARIRLFGDYEAIFRNAPVGNVVRALAEFSQMRYIAPAGDALAGNVSINGTMNILDLLDLLQENYGVGMQFSRGVWRFSKSAPDAAFLKGYVIRNNTRESVEITSPIISSSSNGQGMNGGAQQSGMSMGGSNVGANGSSQANGDIKVKYDDLTKDVEDFINNGTAQGSPAAKVRFVPETGELLVFGSKAQHEIAKQYIATVDKPVEQIEFTAYFIESEDDPTRSLGFNWDTALKITASGDSGTNNFFTIPHAGILTNYQLAAALSFTASDSKSSVSQYPSVVGLPNRKSVIDATRQIPFAQSTFNTGGVGNSSSSTSIQYIDVGTVVTLHPTLRKQEDGATIVRLHVSLVVSSLVGETNISGNPTPLTSRRRFEFSADVPEGRTIAIGGLVSNFTTLTSNKLPFLGDLPIAGRLFRADTDKAQRTNMVVYICPKIIRVGATLVTGSPALPRVWPEDPSFTRPHFDGTDISAAGVRLSLNGFSRELDATQTYLEQRRLPALVEERLNQLRAELKAMRVATSSFKKSDAKTAAALLKEIDAQDGRAAAQRRNSVLSLNL